jgi:hypothetical protein
MTFCRSAGPGWGRSATRPADNPRFVADQFDDLAELKRERTDGDVQWLEPGADHRLAIAPGVSPLPLAAVPAIIRTIRRIRQTVQLSPDLSTGLSTKNRRRTGA